MRRVTPRIVSVWIALSESANVKLSVWDKIVSTGPGSSVFNEAADPPLHTAAKNTIRVGNKLHITVVTISLSSVQALLPGKLYSYNLSFSGPGINSDLKSNKLLEDKSPSASEPIPHLSLGYLPGMLPTFVLPPLTIDKLNLVHGSCRKAHGLGKDSLAVLDFIIKKAVIDNEPDKRPHQLYLTGDQIYADEIPIVLSPAITTVGNSLLGIKENLRVKKRNGAEEIFEATQANFPVLRRQSLTNEYAMFTSDAAINHLLSFGEFCATYIMYWCNAAWPKELFAPKKELEEEKYLQVLDTIAPTEELLETEKELNRRSTETAEEKAKRIAKQKADFKDQYKGQPDDFVTFRKMFPNVRRVLANVPVFMIMDDHEVTDDLYITKDWRDKVLTSPLGVNIIQNGLMAYALFQDWGNDPVTYETGDKADLLSYLQQIFPQLSTSGPIEGIANQIDGLFGFNLNDETPPPIKWHYSVPCSETTVYVLDTRTQWTYETRHNPPGLLSNSALDDQIPLNPQPEKFLIFVSPAPVLGLAVLEELLQPVMTVFNAFEADPEAWAFSPAVFERFLNRIQKFKRVIILNILHN